MKKERLPVILEFECIAPANNADTIGDKIVLSEAGNYLSNCSPSTYHLLFLLDHPLHYRVSKIEMNGVSYVIPADREKNYAPKFHPNTMKYYLGNEPDRKPNT